MATIENNIDELLALLNTSETLLRFNSSIEKEISQHGGTVLYSYNDIIIASEISDNFFVELSKNPFIENIYEVPLKKYGDVDMSLIDQIDVSKIGINLNVTSGDTTIISGNESGSGTISYSGDAPLITNQSLTLNAVTNQWFNYKITASGKLPIKFEIIPNINGQVSISGDTITGFSSIDGNFNITLVATNNFGFDNKTLVVHVVTQPKITSPLIAYGTVGTGFTYTITETGVSYTYRTYGLPSGLSLTGNIISGVLSCVAGVYKFPIVVENSNGSDSKTLELRVSDTSTYLKPIITSGGIANGEEYTDFSYTITSTGTPPISYSVIGTLHNGLTFNSGDTISGVPTIGGIKNVTLKATSPYGTTEKNLKISIDNAHPPAEGG